MFCKGRNIGRADAVGHTAAHSHKYRHIRHADDGLCNTGLRSKGIDGDHGIGIDVLDDGHIGRKHQRLDPAAKHTDTTALTDTAGHLQRVFSQLSFIGGYIFSFHGVSFPLQMSFPL